jgi:hypothetical protein
MKITINSKGVAIGIALVLCVAATSYFKSNTLCQDATQDRSTDLCQNIQQNWLSWVKGDSRSTQFHFVDFLELLNRLTPASSKSH